MIVLDPVTLTGAQQIVNLTIDTACCMKIANESAYGVKVRISGQLERWLEAWTADLFTLPEGTQTVTLTGVVIGPLTNAPSQVALITLALRGEQFEGTYPVALARQMGISSPIPVQVANVIQDQVVNTPSVLPVGQSGAPLGDTTVAALVGDSDTESISTTDPSPNSRLAIASYKPSAGNQCLPVGVPGAIATGTTTKVSPAWGQPTTAGNMGIAYVSYTSNLTTDADATTAAGGWVRDVGILAASAQTNVAIWRKSTLGAGEAPPQFTKAQAGLAPMVAQLIEVGSVLAGGTLDRTGTTVGGFPAVVTASAPDAAYGNFVAVAAQVRYGDGNPHTATFSDTLNNGMTPVPIGNTGATSALWASNYLYGLVPLAKTPAALGIQAFNMRSWPGLYDGQAHAQPAVGTKATVTLAANLTKRWVCDYAEGILFSTTSAAGGQGLYTLIDGVSGGAAILWDDLTLLAAVAASVAAHTPLGPGARFANAAVNTAMTAEWNAAPPANQAQRTTLGAYLQ